MCVRTLLSKEDWKLAATERRMWQHLTTRTICRRLHNKSSSKEASQDVQRQPENYASGAKR